MRLNRVPIIYIGLWLMTSFAEFTKGLQTSNIVTAAKFKKNIIQKSRDDINEETDSYENDSYNTDCSDEKSKDVDRIEEPWTKKIEELIEKWNKDIKKNQKMHDRSGYYYKNSDKNGDYRVYCCRLRWPRSQPYLQRQTG